MHHSPTLDCRHLLILTWAFAWRLSPGFILYYAWLSAEIHHNTHSTLYGTHGILITVTLFSLFGTLALRNINGTALGSIRIVIRRLHRHAASLPQLQIFTMDAAILWFHLCIAALRRQSLITLVMLTASIPLLPFFILFNDEARSLTDIIWIWSTLFLDISLIPFPFCILLAFLHVIRHPPANLIIAVN